MPSFITYGTPTFFLLALKLVEFIQRNETANSGPVARSHRLLLLSLIVAPSLAACVSSKPPADLPGGTLVSYKTGPAPFCERCDSIDLTVASDGRVWVEQGHWAGTYKNWRVVRRHLTLSQDRIAAFRREIDPYRPVGTLALNSPSFCTEFTEDMPTVRIAWREGGNTSELFYHFGCDPKGRAKMRQALDAAPATLGIDGLGEL